MFSFTIDPRNGYDPNACSTCCCEAATAKAGETNLWSLNYAPWSTPLGGMGIVDNIEFNFELITEPATPVISYPSGLGFRASATTIAVGSVAATGATQYALVPFSGPEHGTVLLDTGSGSFTYEVSDNYQQPYVNAEVTDTFWIKASDASGNSIIYEVVVIVGPNSVLANGVPDSTTQDLSINASQVIVNQKTQMVNFPLEASYGAREGSIYRLSIKQKAIDCDGREFYHISCYDITIGKCR